MIPRSSRLVSRTLLSRSATLALQHSSSARPIPSFATAGSLVSSSRSFASSRRSLKDKPWDNPPSNKEGDEKNVSPDGDLAGEPTPAEQASGAEGEDGKSAASTSSGESAGSVDSSSSSSSSESPTSPSSSSSTSTSPSSSASSDSPAPSSSSSKRSSKKPNYPSKLSSSKSSPSTSPISAALSPTPRTSSKASLQDVAEMNYVPVQTLDQLLIIPTNSVVMPHLKRNFNIHDKGVIAAIRDLIKHDKPYVGVFLHQNQGIEDVIASPSEVASTGLVCHIDAFSPKDREETTWLLVIHPISRVRIDSLHPMITPEEAQKIEDEKLAAAEAKQQEEAEPLKLIKEDGDALPEAEQKGDGEVTSFENVDEVSADSGKKEAEGVETKPAEEEINTSLSVSEILAQRAVSVADVSHLLTTSPTSDDAAETARITLETTELHKSILLLFSDLVNKAPKILERASFLPDALRRYYELPMDEFADVVASLTENPTAAERQAVLDATDMRARLRAAMACVKKDLDNLEIMTMVKNEMERAIGERNKEHIIGEQMKALKKISGKKDDREVQLEKFRKNLEGSKMPKDVEEVFESEAAKFLQMDGREAEVGVLRNYLDWLSSIPWGRFTVDSFDLASASRILNEDHYGLDDLKKRIEEFIAVGKIKGTIDGKILCLYGPPGVGKTSIAKSIARALDRKFYRLSLGGMRDVAELKGHRRTYVGALPGKAVAALKQAGSSNPVILLDEIDKVSNINAGGQGGGDPSAALLEMLDPEQNSTFTDAYLDVPLDLSKVLFVCTANEISHLSAPLRDRMEMMEVSGYVTEEKMAIARDYLIPQVAKGTGLEKVDVTVEEEALKSMIEDYARETGVRSLKKLLDRVYRQVAAEVVRSSNELEASSSSTSETAVELDPSLPTSEAPVQGAVPEPAVSSTSPESSSSSSSSSPASSSSSDTTSPSNPSSSSSTTPIVAAPGTTTTLHIKPFSVPSSVSIKVTSENLKDYIGQPSFAKDRIYARAPPPGVCNGLGYNGMGGSLLPIEVTLMPGKGRFQATGKLGDVISESVKIAVSYIRVNAFALGITPQDTDILLGESSDKDLHLHMPDGGTGKDGPSAGIAILSAMISTLTRVPINPDLAMTGELSLGGQVLAVGGLKEKILAAHRAKVTKLILPASVRNTVEKDVPPSVKAGIELVYATNAREVLYEVFKDTHLPAQWKGKFPLEEDYFGIGGLKDAGVGVGGGEPAVDV